MLKQTYHHIRVCFGLKGTNQVRYFQTLSYYFRILFLSPVIRIEMGMRVTGTKIEILQNRLARGTFRIEEKYLEYLRSIKQSN